MIVIADIMTTELYTLKETDSLYDARKMMIERNIRHVPIVDDAGKPIGLVTQRDLLAASLSPLETVDEEQRTAFESLVPLKRVMTTDLTVVSEKMSLREAAMRLREFKYGCLPVVSNGRLKGIITDSDFVTVAIHLLEQLELTEPVDFSDEV